MDAYALFDALTDVQDSFLTETERRLYGKKRCAIGVYLLAAVLIVLLCFTTAMAADVDFRQRVLSLFTVKETPPREEVIQSVTLQGNIQADYIFIPDYAYLQGGMFVVCTDETEYKQGSHYAAYAYENGELVRQENHRFDQTCTYRGKTYRIVFDWAAHDGQVAKTWVPTLDEARQLSPSGPEWGLWGGSPEQYLIVLEERYPLLANLRTGEFVEPLAAFDLSELSYHYHPNYAWHSEDFSRWLLPTFSEDAMDYVYFDTLSGKSYHVSELCGHLFPRDADFSGSYNAKVLEDKLVCWWLEEGETPSGLIYGCRIDLNTLEKLLLFDGIPLNADDGYRTIPGLVFLPRLQMNGGRLAMEVAEDRSVTLIDLKTAQRIPVEGYTLPQRQALHQTTVTVSNPSGTRLLVAACEPGHIFSYDNIAVLGLDGGFLLERSGLDPEVLERDITWLDDDRFVILCQVENDHYAVTGSWFYIYDLSEKNDNAE